MLLGLTFIVSSFGSYFLGGSITRTLQTAFGEHYCPYFHIIFSVVRTVQWYVGTLARGHTVIWAHISVSAVPAHYSSLTTVMTYTYTFCEVHKQFNDQQTPILPWREKQQ